MTRSFTLMLYLVMVVLSPMQGLACEHMPPDLPSQSLNHVSAHQAHVEVMADMPDCHPSDTAKDSTCCLLDCAHCAASAACVSSTSLPEARLLNDQLVTLMSSIQPAHIDKRLRPPIVA